MDEKEHHKRFGCTTCEECTGKELNNLDNLIKKARQEGYKEGWDDAKNVPDMSKKELKS